MDGDGRKMSSADELRYCPDRVEIVATRVDGDIEDPAYIIAVSTPDKDCWPVLRRWSACTQLRDRMCADDNPALRGVPFPKENLFFGSFGQVLEQGAEGAGATPASQLRKQQQLERVRLLQGRGGRVDRGSAGEAPGERGRALERSSRHPSELCAAVAEAAAAFRRKVEIFQFEVTASSA